MDLARGLGFRARAEHTSPDSEGQSRSPRGASGHTTRLTRSGFVRTLSRPRSWSSSALSRTTSSFASDHCRVGHGSTRRDPARWSLLPECNAGSCFFAGRSGVVVVLVVTGCCEVEEGVAVAAVGVGVAAGYSVDLDVDTSMDM